VIVAWPPGPVYAGGKSGWKRAQLSSSELMTPGGHRHLPLRKRLPLTQQWQRVPTRATGPG